MVEDYIRNLQTVNGNLIKYAGPYTSACLFELTENVLLEINVEQNTVSFLVKDEKDIYRSFFDIMVTSDNVNELSLEAISPAIEKILIGKDRNPITNPLGAIDIIEFKLNRDQMHIWGKKHRK